LVWGVEAPQVVINETYAIEDPSAPGAPQLWFELFNPQHTDPIDNGIKSISAGRARTVLTRSYGRHEPGHPGSVTPVGEPSSIARRLEFRAPTPLRRAALDRQLSIRTTIIWWSEDRRRRRANAATGFRCAGRNLLASVTEIGTPIRLYLRRLADPTNAHDPGPDGIDGTADDVNPYLTVDALNVQVYSATDVNPPR